ncbi:MAG: RpiB/LacA/LacB family sugar-phosphate isomerase [Patescibacteria group bacterium]|nr:RpiB/LacA/LacB family sugar-phosphate isomerase [Patescibacteria group bacterium]MDE2438544.1 RpiB/LacA/LacB family sugar-phosphate isomerase [Patescibacteria group bacterium]
MKIYLGTDHAGFELKESIKSFLLEKGYEVQDCGAFSFDPGDDYPDFIRPAAEAVAQDESSRGIVLGGSGEGEAMVANRIPGVRATVYYGGSHEIIRLSRAHNNANVLSLGARFVSKEEAFTVIALWLETPFSEEERHKRRLAKF